MGTPAVPMNHIAGVPVEIGHPLHINAKKQLQRQINAILGWNDTDRAPMAIAQPVLRINEPQIAEHPYFVCERSVGIRYLVLLLHGRCYLISQNYDFRELPMFCPVRPDRLQPGADRSTIFPHQWTLLDGDLVCDKDQQKSSLTFLICDLLVLNGSPTVSLKLQERLKLIQNDVIHPKRTIPMPKGHPPDVFQLVLQSMYPTNRVSHVIRTILPRVSQTRQNAGLLFTPVSLAYSPGYSKGLFQWTQRSLLTVDFQLGVEWRGRPPKPGFKLMVHEKRTSVFHDWITFSPEEYELFHQDKKATTRIVECAYDPEWLVFIPSHDKSTWDIGNPDFNATDKGPGWRRGGWKFLRIRPDKNCPMESSLISSIEKAFGEDIRLEEIERFFPDESKKPLLPIPKTRPNETQEGQDGSKKKRGTGGVQAPGTGVCYDFQNKGVCQRGRFCHFSHCACNSTCSCTSAKNTYGQRPTYRRNDYDAPPSPEHSSNNTDTEHPPGQRGPDGANTYDQGLKPELSPEEEEAGELVDTPAFFGSGSNSSVFAPLEKFDKDTIAAKRLQLSLLGNKRIWSSLGLEPKPQKKRPTGLVVSKAGEVSFLRGDK